MQDGVEIRCERRLGPIRLGTRPATSAEVLQRLGSQPLFIALPGMVAVPLHNLQDAAVLQGKLPPDDASRPIQAQSLKQLASEGWRFFTDEGEVGLFGAYEQTVEARKDGRSVVLENQQTAAGLVEFYRRPPLEGRLENEGFRFFTPEGKPSSAFASRQGALIGKDGQAWLALGSGSESELRQRLQRFEQVLAGLDGDVAGARAAFHCLERSQGQPPLEQAKQLMAEVKGSTRLAASLVSRPEDLQALGQRCEDPKVLLPLVERLAELNETGRVGLAVSRSVKKPTGILQTTLGNATGDASQVLPPEHPPEALNALLKALESTRPDQVRLARQWVGFCQEPASHQRIASQVLTGGGAAEVLSAMKQGWYENSSRDQVAFGLGVLPTLKGPASELALRMLAVEKHPSVVEAGLAHAGATGPKELARMMAEALPGEGASPKLMSLILDELDKHPDTRESARLGRELGALVKGDKSRAFILREVIRNPDLVGAGEAVLAASRATWFEEAQPDRLALGKHLLASMQGKAASLGLRILKQDNVDQVLPAVLAHRQASTPAELAALALEAVPSDGAMQPLWNELAIHPETAAQAELARELMDLVKDGRGHQIIASTVLSQPAPRNAPELAALGGAILAKCRATWYEGIDKDRASLGKHLLEQLAQDPSTRTAADLGLSMLNSSNADQVVPATLAHATARTPVELAALVLAAVPEDGAMEAAWKELAGPTETRERTALARELNRVVKQPGSRKLIAQQVLQQPESPDLALLGHALTTAMKATWYEGVGADRLALGRHLLGRLESQSETRMAAQLGLQMLAPLKPGDSADGILLAVLANARATAPVALAGAVPHEGESEAMKPLLDALAAVPETAEVAHLARELDAVVSQGRGRAIVWRHVLDTPRGTAALGGAILEEMARTYYDGIDQDRLALGQHLLGKLSSQPETSEVARLALAMGPHAEVHRAAMKCSRSGLGDFVRAAIPDDAPSALLEPAFQALGTPLADLLPQLKTNRLRSLMARALLDQPSLEAVARQTFQGASRTYADGLEKDCTRLAGLLLARDTGPLSDFIRDTIARLPGKPPDKLLVDYYLSPDAHLLLRGRAFLAGVSEDRVVECAQRFLKLPELSDSKLLTPMLKQASARLTGVPVECARAQVLAELDRLATQAGIVNQVESLLVDDSATLVKEDAARVTVGNVTVRRKGSNQAG